MLDTGDGESEFRHHSFNSEHLLKSFVSWISKKSFLRVPSAAPQGWCFKPNVKKRVSLKFIWLTRLNALYDKAWGVQIKFSSRGDLPSPSFFLKSFLSNITQEKIFHISERENLRGIITVQFKLTQLITNLVKWLRKGFFAVCSETKICNS